MMCTACVQGAGAESFMCTDRSLLLDLRVQQQAYPTETVPFELSAIPTECQLLRAPLSSYAHRILC